MIDRSPLVIADFLQYLVFGLESTGKTSSKIRRDCSQCRDMAALPPERVMRSQP
jgi:hypothetical protein